MPLEKNKKKSAEISTILLSLFIILIAVLGAGIYYVPDKYFLDRESEFDYSSSRQVVSKKTAELKQFDLEIFGKDKFTSLKKGYWHVFPEAELTVGNEFPFGLKVEELVGE